MQEWPADRVERRRTATLVPYARNARTHSEAQVAQIAASVREWGWTVPVLVDESGTIIAGHGRVLAAQSLGLDEVPVMVASGWTDAQRRAYVLADNRLALNAGWDTELLKLEMAELSEAGYDLALTGLDDAEIEQLLATDVAVGDESGDEQESVEPDATDDVPATPATPVSRPGDVWQIGAHRLICGDATDPAVVRTLMAGEQAALCFTSPPYGNQRDYTTGGISDWDALMQGVFQHLPAILAEDGQALVNLGLIHRDGEWQPYWQGWLDWMRAQGWRRFGLYAWDQGPGLPGDWNGRLAPAYELVFHFNRKSRQPNKIIPCKWAGTENKGSGLRAADGEVKAYTHAGLPVQEMRIPDSVLRITRHKGRGIETEHPAVFPVALPEFVIEAYTDAGDIVFEPFGGSGTTMLAAERTGRICCSVEIAPQYVDVAIKRFQQNHPGIPVTLIATGQSFEQVAAERATTPDAEVVA